MQVLRTGVLASTFALGLCTVVFAQDRVTIMLRSGETVAGRFDGINQGLFYIDVSDTDERKIPLGQVVVVDLTGGATNLPETELGPARGGSHVLVTRSGNVIKGELDKVDGARVGEATVVFRAEGGGEQRIPMRDVARLYFGNYPGGAPSTSTSNPTTTTPGGVQTSGQQRVVTLPGNQQWIDTGLTVRQGEGLVISATGEVMYSPDGNDKASPNGSLRGAKVGGSPAPDLPAGALIGRIGNGAPFGIGQGQTMNAPGSGRLYLGINDDNVSDNSGSFQVRVTPTSSGSDSGRRRRP